VQLYLPIADIPVNVFLILAMGAAVGFRVRHVRHRRRVLDDAAADFVGIAPAVAVASVASHIAASSFSGAISTGAPRHRSGPGAGAAEWRTIGTALGVWTFTL